jgi:hypothetical protein
MPLIQHQPGESFSTYQAINAQNTEIAKKNADLQAADTKGLAAAKKGLPSVESAFERDKGLETDLRADPQTLSDVTGNVTGGFAKEHPYLLPFFGPVLAGDIGGLTSGKPGGYQTKLTQFVGSSVVPAIEEMKKAVGGRMTNIDVGIAKANASRAGEPQQNTGDRLQAIKDTGLANEELMARTLIAAQEQPPANNPKYANVRVMMSNINNGYPAQRGLEDTPIDVRNSASAVADWNNAPSGAYIMTPAGLKQKP